VRTDNEENALLCIKVIIDIMRHRTKVVGDEFQPFFDLIPHVVDQIKKLVMEQFEPHNSTPRISLPGSQQQTIPFAMDSFKVLAECLAIDDSIFRVYQPKDIKLSFQSIESVLLLQAKPQEQAHAEAEAKGTIFTGVSPNNRAVFSEFIRTQAKALSFLANLVRFSELTELAEFKDFLPTLRYIVIRLLKDCPRESSGVRQELFVAMRYIFIHFRVPFRDLIDELLDPRILIDDGLTVYETLRPLAYSTVAELIYYLRDTLEPPQIRKTIEVYIKNLQDDFPGTGFQSMSAKLLFNMAECTANMPNKVDARYYLIMILNAIGDKFATLNRQYPNAVKLSKLYAQTDKDHVPDWDEIDIFTAMPIKTRDPRNPVEENKYLFKTLINGLANIFCQLKVCKIGSEVSGFTAEEIQVLIKLFHEAPYVFQYYETDKSVTESHANALELLANRHFSSTKGEEKGLLNAFVAVLEMDPTTSHEIFYRQISKDNAQQLSEILPKLIQKHEQMIRIERVFNTSAEKWFDDLNHSDVTEVRNWTRFVQVATSRIYAFERIDDGSHLEKAALLNQFQERKVQLTRNRPIEAALNTVIWRVQEFGFSVASILCIKSSTRLIINVKKDVLKTRVRLSQKCVAMPGHYLEPFVEIAIDGVQGIEEMAHRTRSSTFRARLYKYSNLYYKELWALLLKKIEEQKYGRFFAQILEHLGSGPLRKVVVENVGTLIGISGDMSAGARYTTVINSILIMHSLCKFEADREWMDKKEITIWLKIVGKNLAAHLRANTLPPHLRLAAEQTSEQLMVIFIKFLEYHPTNFDALFSLIDSVANEDFRSTQPLRAYIFHHITSNSIEYCKTIVLRSLEVYASKGASQKTKTFLLHYIVNPIIAMDVMRTSKQESPKSPHLIDKAVIESIHTKIWKVSLGDPNDGLEVLQLTALLVKHHHSIPHDIRQDIIQFGFTRTEDSVYKHAADVVMGYCAANFEIPTKIIQQVYTSTLESRHCALVVQVLELIAPDLCNAVLVAVPRRILTEEGQDAEKITSVLHFLVKHADRFYEDREMFIVPIVESLRVIAPLSKNSSLQGKKLAHQLIRLVLQWERQRVNGKKPLSTEKRKSEGLGEQLISSPAL
jgi:hypothetical protein